MADEILQKGAGTLLGEADKAIAEAMEMIASDPEAAKQRLQQVGAALRVMADKATAPANENATAPTASVNTAAPEVGKTMPSVPAPSSSSGGQVSAIPGEMLESMQSMAKAMQALASRMEAIEKKATPAGNPAAPAGDIPNLPAVQRSPLQKAMIAGDMSEAQRITGGDLSQMYREVDNLVRESLVKSGITLAGRFITVSNPLQ